MASFVAKILEHADQLEQKSIQEKLDALTLKLTEMDLEMQQLVESKFVHFHPNLTAADSLRHRVQQVQDEMSAIEDKFSGQMKSHLMLQTVDLNKLAEELSQAKTILSGLAFLSEVYNLLQNSARCLEERKYSEAAVALQSLETHLKRPLTDQDDRITILATLKTELKVQCAQLECDLSDLWNDMVKWTVTKSPEGSEEASVKGLSFSVTCRGANDTELQDLVEGLHVSKLLISKMKGFADWFQKYLVPFVTENLQLTITVDSTGQTKTLQVSLQDRQSLSKPHSKHSPDVSEKICQDHAYTCVFANLLNILESLHTLFLHVEYGRHDTSKSGGLSDLSISDSGAAVSRSSQGKLMSLLGQAVSPWLLDLLQKTVLAKAVPSSSKDLAAFDDVISATKLLQDQLLSLGFIEPDNKILLQSVQDVNMLYANKKSQTTLEKAHVLMTSDLHDTVAVSEDKPLGEWPPLTPGGVKKGKWMELAGADHQLSDNTLRMPKCRISESIQTLVSLAYDTLGEATESSPECATQMFYAVRGIFELYCHIVPTHHSHNFETLPQIAALHHNNCMFIAHQLLTLGHQFAPKLPAPNNYTFVDLIQKIRISGVQVFMSQITRQRALLLEYLNGAEGFAHLEEENSFHKADRAIRQVMLQLSHLHKVWKPVLPVSVYKKAMGRLVDAVVEQISNTVTSLEDIAAAGAQKLAVMLASMEQGCGELMASPGEVANLELIRHVPKWPRLTELKFMLGASLSDIADRWADGSGPLAVSFTALEVKQLVRALFQNTERRASLLATIK